MAGRHLVLLTLVCGAALSLAALAGRLRGGPSGLEAARGTGGGGAAPARQQTLKAGGMSHYVTSDPFPGMYAQGAMQGSHHLDWPHAGRFAQAAMDPLNGKAFLVPDSRHPGYTRLTKDARMRLRAYRAWRKAHPNTLPSLSLTNLDAASEPAPTASESKLLRLGVNI